MSLERPKQFVQSRCPNCSTLYHIDQETLAEAGGRARCFRCGTVFDATAQRDGEAAADGEPGRETGPTPARLVESREPLPQREPTPVRAAARTRPGRAPGAAPRPRSRPLPRPPVGPGAGSASVPGPGPAAEPPPFEIPEDLPDLQPTEAPDAATPPRRGRRGRRLAGVLKLLLVLVLLLGGLTQWLWFQPQHLESLRPYYADLRDWCDRQVCPFDLPALPVKRDLAAFTVLEREIGPARGRCG